MVRIATMNTSMSTKKLFMNFWNLDLGFLVGSCHSIFSVLFHEVFKHYRGMHQFGVYLKGI